MGGAQSLSGWFVIFDGSTRTRCPLPNILQVKIHERFNLSRVRVTIGKVILPRPLAATLP
jgi:hypothetical protein